MTPADDSLCQHDRPGGAKFNNSNSTAECRMTATEVPDMQELECNYSLEKTKSRDCRNFQQSHGRRNLSSKVGGTSPCERRICSSINSATRGSLQAATAEEEREFPTRKKGKESSNLCSRNSLEAAAQTGKNLVSDLSYKFWFNTTILDLLSNIQNSPRVSMTEKPWFLQTTLIMCGCSASISITCSIYHRIKE